LVHITHPKKKNTAAEHKIKKPHITARIHIYQSFSENGRLTGESVPVTHHHHQLSWTPLFKFSKVCSNFSL
jgi:hypothetical protein